MANKKQLRFTAPAAAAKAAALGLLLRRKFGRGGTAVGIARARDLKNRRALEARTILRMYSFFARHEIDKRSAFFGSAAKPSNGYIAWLLWGGDPGRRFAIAARRKILAAKGRPK